MARAVDYQWMFRKSPAMATSIAEDGSYVDVNDTFLERLGYERGEMVGRRPSDFVTPASARRIEEEFLPALRRTGKLDNKPIAFVSASGEIVECMTNSIVEYDPDGASARLCYFISSPSSGADPKTATCIAARCNWTS